MKTSKIQHQKVQVRSLQGMTGPQMPMGPLICPPPRPLNQLEGHPEAALHRECTSAPLYTPGSSPRSSSSAVALRPPALLPLLLLVVVGGSYGASFECKDNTLQLVVGTATYNLITCGVGTTCDKVSGSCKEVGGGGVPTIDNFVCLTGTSGKTFSFLGNCDKYITCSSNDPPTANDCTEGTQYYHSFNICIPTADFKKIVGDCYTGERNCRRSDVAFYQEPNPADPREMVVCSNGTLVAVVGCPNAYNPSTEGCV